MLVRLTAALAFAALAGVAAHAEESAQAYPSRPVKIVVPFPAGGSADLLPRILAEKLAAKWGQPVLVENRPGAGGNIGAEAVYKSDPDGYTLLATPPGPLVINPHIYPKLGYDPSRFAPVTILATIPNVLLVNAERGAKSVRELIAEAKAHPGKLNYGSQGNGTTSHLTAELFKTMAGGLRIAHVPYKGSAPENAALLAGEVDFIFDNLGTSMANIRAGKFRALAVCSEKPVESLPGVPALDAILPGFVSVTWFGVVAPPKTPAAIAEKISVAIAEATRQPDVRKRFSALSAEPVADTPAQMTAFMKEEEARWEKVIEAARVKLD